MTRFGMRARVAAFGVGLLSAGCASEGPEFEFDVPEPCGPGGESDLVRPFGTLEGAEHWDCVAPDAGDGTLRFTDYDGPTSVISGGSTRIELDWAGGPTLEGHLAVLTVVGTSGYYLFHLDGAQGAFPLELYFDNQAIDRDFTLGIAVDDGTGTPESLHVGEYLLIPFSLIRVQGGDVQVSVTWDTATDVDLHVIDPFGDEIYWGQPWSTSGGELDLDSNPACYVDGVNNENVYWATGTAPHGTYSVLVDYWSACAVAGSTGFRVTIVLGGQDVVSFDDSFTAADADAGGAGSGRFITSFEW